MKTLDQLAIYYGSDKSSQHHNYCKHYESHFSTMRSTPVKLLELGIGGYEFKDRGGAGLRMWQSYFTNKHSRFYSVDLYDKSGLDFLDTRTKIFMGSQNDGDFLLELMKEINTPDIIIDDVSHVNPLTIRTFEILYPLLKDGGIYVVEDAHTSYWPDAGFEGCEDRENKTHPHIHNYITKQLALAKDLGGGMTLLHRDEKLIILRK